MVNNLRVKREERGLSQRELSERAHLPQSEVSDFERGARKVWPTAAQKLSKALGIPVAQLFPQD